MKSCSGMQERMLDAAGRTCPPADRQMSAHLDVCDDCRALFRGLEVVNLAFGKLAQAPPPAIPPFNAIRAKATAAAQGLRRRSSLRRLLPSIVLALSSAVAAMLLAGLTFGGRRTKAVRAGDVLESGGRVRSAVLPSGARVVLESGRLLISGGELHERLRLESGAVSVRVPRLPPGAALSVETADGDVQAHGTRFRVDRSAEGTRVVLSEGMVIIHPSGPGRADIALHPGEAALVEPLDGYRERQLTTALAVLKRGQRDGAAEALGKLLATQPKGVKGGEAHALMGWARQVRGELDAAADEYRRALEMTTGSSAELWADNAAVELALLEERRGADGGIAAWRDYLARFPSGLHRSLAAAHLRRLRER
jgi:hypothetical protein